MDCVNLLYIDLFCGAGGTSTGVEKAAVNGSKCAKVIACVNHDANAIASHAANHPEALHFTEDIRTLDLAPLKSHLEIKRAIYSNAYIVRWASLECTNFSKAKGGQPRDADSRTLAEHLFRYIETIKPDYIQIENVEEFMCWGDMDENGKPVSKEKGKRYVRWCNKVQSYGYEFDHRILNAADYGAYTSRKRFFGIFAKKGLPIVFPYQTHAKNVETQSKGLFQMESLQPWKAVKEVLDFNDRGETIFRKKPLCEKTLSRIYAGLVKFVAGGKESFLVKWNSWNKNGKYNAPGIEEPCPVVSTQNRLGVACVSFLSKVYSGDPMSKNISVEGPAGTVTCKDHHVFLTAYYGNGHNHGVNGPAPTLTTNDRLAFIDMQYGNGTPSDINHPSNDNNMLPFIHQTEERLVYEIYESDSPMTKNIKEFMAIYGIVNITMRMLRVLLKLHQVNYVDETNLDFRHIVTKNGNSGKCFLRRSITTACKNYIRLLALIVTCPIPDTDTLGTMLNSLVHSQPLMARMLGCNDNIYIVLTADTMIEAGK